MSQSDLTASEVQDLVYDWFRKLTDKAPAAELMAMLSSDDLEMQFPGKMLRSYADFTEWLDTVTHLFFDQVHDVKFLTIDLAGERAEVHLIVNWQARTWKAPAAYSEWQGSYVHQDWTIVRDRQSGRAVIGKYRVGTFDPMRA